MMRQTAKTWLIIAASLVLIGILAFVGIMTRNHWDFSALSTVKFETNTVDVNEGFQSISIISDTADIALLPSGDGKCRVDFYEWEKVRHTASVRDGTLMIEVIDTRSWFDQIGFFLGSPKITVYLPQTAYASLSIEQSTGNVVIPEDFTFERIGISVSTGDVDCCASASGIIRIGTRTGHIHAEGLSAGALELSVSTGRVDVRSITCDGTVGVTVSTGKALLADVSCGSLISSGSTGDITLKNVIAAEQISIERSTGDVSFEQGDAAELLIKTDTGDVTGTLLSEKVFITQSDTGRIEVPETVTGGKCKITTDTGDINIEIK